MKTETVQATAPALSTLNLEELQIVAWLAAKVRQDIRKKVISLRSLRAIDGSKPLYNPYHSSIRNITPELWARVMVSVGGRIDDTCTGLVDLERRAETAIEVIKNAPVPAADVSGLSHNEIAEKMEAESDSQTCTRPVTRGYLVTHFKSIFASYIRHGHQFEESTVIYMLDTLRSYRLMTYAEYEVLYNRIRISGSMAGKATTERQKVIIDAMCHALATGTDVKAAIWKVTVM